MTSVLIVEDELVTALDLERVLTRFGYEVLGVVPTGEEALTLAAEHEPDVAVLDVRLAGPMDGVDVAAALRRRSGTPAVFLSANSDDATVARAADAEAYGFLTKPFNERELRNAIELAVRQRTLRRQLADDRSRASLRARVLDEENRALTLERAVLEQEARRDGLTGLFNRRELDARLGAEVARTLDAGAPLAVALLDVDFFKAINDGHGHLAGDAVLRELAARLTAHLRPGDLLARYGGEELIAVLPGTPLREAFLVGERLRRCVEVNPFNVAPGRQGIGPSLRVTVSVGVAALEPPHDDPTALVGRADGALYAAKATGRNRTLTSHGPRAADTSATSPELGTARRIDPAHADGALRVLVVDDDSGARRALERVLGSLGYRVELCSHGEEALARLAEPAAAIDALITDLAMPGLGGLALLREARALRPGLPAVVLTGHATLDAALEAIELGIFRFLRKPPSPVELASVLGEIDARRSPASPLPRGLIRP